MTDYEDLQKCCQRGSTNLNDANNLLADCYGMLGRLVAENEALRAGQPQNCRSCGKLQVDNEALRTQVQSMIDQTEPLVPVPGDPGWSRRITIDELQAEVADLRKDAERYRWLKEKGLHRLIEADTAAISPGVGPFICVQLPSSGAPNSIRLAASADEYIDLAMSNEG